MDLITDDIERALEHRLYYLAVMGALSLPDICSAAETDGGYATRDKYVNWCDVWLAGYKPFLHGSDFYSIRCAIFHKGSIEGDSPTQYERVIFNIPAEDIPTPHNIAVGDKALAVDAGRFTQDILNASRVWYGKHSENANVEKHFKRMARLAPSGFGPIVWQGDGFACFPSK